MRYLFRLAPYDRDTESAVRLLRGIASSVGGRAVNPKRTSYGSLEMDVFTQSRQDFDLFLAAVEPLGRLEFFRDLQAPPQFLPKSQAVAEAVSLFNGERFWEAHEVLESVWRTSTGDEKRLLQGLILVCAALVHQQKGEDGVAVGVAKRAVPLLVWPLQEYYGVRLTRLKATLEREIEGERLSVFRI